MRRRNPVEVQALPYGCLDLEGRICGTKLLKQLSCAARREARRAWIGETAVLQRPAAADELNHSSPRALQLRDPFVDSGGPRNGELGPVLALGRVACENLANSVEISSRVRLGSPKRRPGHLLDVGGY